MSEREKEASGRDVRLTVTLLKRQECDGRRRKRTTLRLVGDKRRVLKKIGECSDENADAENALKKRSSNVCSCHIYCLEAHSLKSLFRKLTFLPICSGK